MRVLFLTHYFHPEGNAPGTRVYELCRRWVRMGHDVTVITGVPNIPDGVAYEGYRNRCFQRECVDGIETIHPAHDATLTHYYRQLARDFILLETGGSDYHGPRPGEADSMGRYSIPYPWLERARSAVGKVRVP